MDEMTDDGLYIDRHFVSWPRSVSDEARDMLRRFHETNVTGDSPFPPLNDKPAWRQHVEDVNQAILINSPMYAVPHRENITSESKSINGVDVHIATPADIASDLVGKVFLEIHGGGMIYLQGEGTRRGSLREAERLGVRTVSIDFRVPPDHPYPCGLDDCVSAYAGLLKDYAPKDIIVGGISGGGNLAAAMLLRARDEQLPLPAACILLTPETDLTESGDTFESLAGLDPVLPGRLTTLIAVYAGANDLTHPYLSPLFGDFSKGFPPTFLQSGTRDKLLSNTVRMHRALRSAGIVAELHVWEGMPHGGFMKSPEDDEIAQEMKRFMTEHWA